MSEKLAQSIRVGDAIVFCGREYRVAVIDAYHGTLGDLGAFGVARTSDGDFALTLFRGQRLEVASS